MHEKPKAIVFDMDLTLIDSFDSAFRKHKHTAKKFYNIEIDEEKMKKHWGKSMQDALAGVYDNADTYENIITNIKSILNEDNFHPVPFPGAVELIEKLSSQFTLGVLTSTNSEFAINNLMNAGFDLANFNFIFGADDTPVHKPNPAVFEPVFEKLRIKNVERDETIYVGDSIYDWQAARDAKMGFIAVTTGLHTKEEFIDEGMDGKFIVESLIEIEGLITN